MYCHTNVKIQMLRNGLTVAELAAKTGISEASIYTILRGGDTRISTLQKIADALKCSIADFCAPLVESKVSG